jgi:hypothetical protein
MGKPEGGSVAEYGANLGKDFMGQTFLQGVQQPLAAINDPARYGQSYVGNQTASAIPNIVKDFTKSQDPYARENNNIGDYVSNSLPGRENRSVVKRDNLGNPIPQEPTGPGAFVDLFNSKTPISNPVVDELSRLNATGNNATPSKLNKSQTINGEKTKLTPQQLDVLESKSGPAATQALEQLFKDPSYQALPDEQKAKAVDSVISAARKQVRGNIDLNATPSNIPSGSIVSPQDAANGLTTPTSSTSGLNGSYTLVDPETGNVKKIDLSTPIIPPTQTGSTALDKLAISKYNSQITSRTNDIYALYQAGKISQDQAAQALQSMQDQKFVKQKATGSKKKGAGVQVHISMKRSHPKGVSLSSLKTGSVKLASTKKVSLGSISKASSKKLYNSKTTIKLPTRRLASRSLYSIRG